MYCAMMSKIRKMQDTWVAKSIFILTALSFMSLFGISGYINSADKNRAVIKVDDIELSQAELSYLYEKDLNNARKMFGDALNFLMLLFKKPLRKIILLSVMTWCAKLFILKVNLWTDKVVSINIVSTLC